MASGSSGNMDRKETGGGSYYVSIAAWIADSNPTARGTVFPRINCARSVYFRSTNCARTIRGRGLNKGAVYFIEQAKCSTDNLSMRN